MALLEEPIKEVKTIKNFIAGEWGESKGEIVDVVNPATGKTIARVPISTKDEIDAAVEAAKEAFPDWRATPPVARARCLFRMKEHPPNHLDTVSCDPLPEWAEAINMLRRASVLEPDEFGKYNGTDLALQSSIAVVWWSLVELLIETGRIERSWVDDVVEDRGAASREARRLLFPTPTTGTSA